VVDGAERTLDVTHVRRIQVRAGRRASISQARGRADHFFCRAVHHFQIHNEV
jgi:hypothetical protein